MTDPYTKKPVCLTCNKKVLEAEYVESHKALGHRVEEYIFGSPKRAVPLSEESHGQGNSQEVSE